MAKTSDEQLISLTFPVEGVDETRAFGAQKPGTCIDALNVRTFEPETDRARGGRRAGISKYLSEPVVTDSVSGLGVPIQDINNISTTDVSPGGDTGSLVAPFTYGLASGGGFGIAKGTDGTALAASPIGVNSGYIFRCSCWDDEGNCYAGFQNTTTGACIFYKTDSTGAIASGWPTPAARYNVGSGSHRGIAGMTVIKAVKDGVTERFLWVAFALSNQAGYLYKINASTAADMGSLFSVALEGTFTFSTNCHNSIGKIGTLLGIDNYGSGNGSFKIFETNNFNPPTGNSSGFVYKAVKTYEGSSTNAHSKVVSDGTDWFYVISSDSGAQKVRKISTGAQFAPSWSSATVTGLGGTITGLAYDSSVTPTALVCTATADPSFRRISTADGSNISADTKSPPIAPGTPVTQWDEVDSDNQGTFILWRNSVASLDVMSLNSTFATGWGPSTLADAVHYGASVSKAAAPAPPPVHSTGGSRQVRAIVVADGTAFEFDFLRETRPVPLGANTVLFSKTRPQIWSAQCGLDLFYVDGSVYQYYKSSNSTMTKWTLTAGTLPFDSANRAARLICAWRGRLVLAGLIGDPKNYFMCVPHNPLNWDYSAIFSETVAFAGAVSNVPSDSGPVDDIVTCLMPYSEDLLFLGGDHSITRMTGDPAAGGRLDTISDTIGVAWGRPFCKDPAGQLYFFSSQGGVYLMAPGAYPIQLSQKIKKRLQQVDVQNSHIRLAWDLDRQGMAVFITPDNGDETTNYFWEERTGAWQPDFYAERGFNPRSVHVLDGDIAGDRTVLLGCTDGYMRALDNSATDDDGEDIDSYVVIGPMMTKELSIITIKSLQATLGANSGDVRFDIYAGTSAEAAFASSPILSHGGTWKAGRNNVSPISLSAHAFYIKISSSDPWSMEVIQAAIRTKGTIASRTGGNTR